MKKKSTHNTFDFSILVPEAEFDSITRLAAAICEVPISLITFLGEETQYIKSAYGLKISETPIEHSFCSYAVQNGQKIFMVKDARKDARFKNNPYVKEKKGVVFYAGVPLSRKDTDLPLGTLCVIDQKPRKLTHNQLEALTTLAVQVERLLELRASKQALEEEKAAVIDKSERLENIINATEVGTWEWNLETGVVTINSRYASMIGYTVKELTPFTLDTWYKILHPDDHKLADRALKECFDSKIEFYDIECRLIHKKGQVVWVNDRGKVVKRDANGKALMVMGTHTEITERKNTEALFKTISDNIPGVVFRYLRQEGKIDLLQFVSKGAEEVWGYTAEEVTKDNMLVWNLILKEDVKGLLQSIEASEKNLKPWTFEWRYHHPDGSVKWHKGTGNPTRHTKKSIFWDCIILDITAQKDFEQQLVTASENLRERIKEQQCLYVITHLSQEVDNPETLLRKTVEILPNGFLKPEALLVTINYKGKTYKNRPHKQPLLSLQKIKKNREGQPLEISVSYLKSSGIDPGGPFLDEEKKLLDTLAENLITNINRLELQKELLLKDERHRIINSATNDAIYDWDIVKDVFEWGDAFKILFGHDYSSKPFKLADWIVLTHPIDEEKRRSRWSDFLKNPQETHWENQFRFLKADGSFAFVEEIGYLVRDSKHKPLRMIGVLRDKTEQKNKEIQNEIQNHISSLFNKANLSIHQITHKTLDYLAGYAGFETAELWMIGSQKKHLNLIQTYQKSGIGKNFFKLTRTVNKLKKGEGLPGHVWKNNSAEIWDKLGANKKYLRREAAKANGIKSAIGLPLFHNQKAVGVLMLSSTMEAKKIKETLTFFSSLTHFLGAELKRKQQEEELHQFFNNAPDILAIAGQDGYFVKVNPAFCSLLGYTEEELTTQPFVHFIHPDDLKGTEKEYSETITGERLANNFINRYRTKSGEYRWISWNSSDVYGEDKQAFAYGRDITEQVKLQQLFETAAKMAKMGSWELDLTKTSNNNLFWSSITREMFEVPVDYNPSNSGGLEFFVGEHKRNLSQAIQNLIQTGEIFDLELLILTGAGNRKWVRCMGQSDRIQDKCFKIYGNFQDIDQRKASEEKAKHTLKERDAILESIGDAFFAVDPDWYVTYWNHKAEELLMTKKEDILHKHLWRVFSGYVGQKSYTEYHNALKYNEITHFEDYFAENERWLEISAYPSENGLSVYFKDITERKKYEKELQQANERFEKVTEATNDAVWDFDVINNRLFWGKGFEKQFGFPLNEFEPTLDLLISRIHPNDRTHISEKIKKYMTDGQSIHWFEEYRFEKSDGTYAYVIDRAIFTRDANGNVTRVVGAMTDISYRKEYEDSLKQLNEKLKRHTKELELSNQELEQFAYVTSHDLQEPLRMISSFLMLLEKKYGDKLDEKAHEYIFFAVDGAKRMKKIILDLLEYSKVGRFEEDPELVEVNELIDEYCILRKKIIQEKEAVIHYNNLPVIHTYRVPFTQILHNLIDNALKYSKEDRPAEVTIKAQETDKMWEFSVADNGIGIDKDYFQKIFVIFQRLHNKEVYDGTGMGLAIVKKILETLDGKIWVTSKPGKGSTFYFTLPKIEKHQ